MCAFLTRGGPAVAVVGADGRLGSAVLDACRREGVPVTMTATRTGRSELGVPSVVVDAAPGSALPETLAYCRAHGAALICCASDVTPEGLAALHEYAEVSTVVRATNLSVGHWLQTRLITQLGGLLRELPVPATATVIERHTAAKLDRPSATARVLAEVWSLCTGTAVSDLASYRSGMRVSEHTVDVMLGEETISVRHHVQDLQAAAAGALLAVRWAHAAPAGFRTIDEVLTEVLAAPRQGEVDAP
jgi:4-hydroxy-tetrahydrodipicolinate reductase